MKERSEATPWMYVSILLGVLLVVSVSTNFLTYSAISKAISGGIAGTPGTGTVAPTPAPGPSPPVVAPSPGTPVDVDLSGAYARGPENAKVTIVEYSDFQCPFCQRAYPTVKALQTKYGNDVRIVYKHFPLSFHPQAQISAEASECAGEQGKFWEYHDKIFENQAGLSGGAPTLKQWAKDLALNTAQFDSCLDTGKYTSKVNADFSEGQADGVSGTPSFFINGQMIVGAQPQTAFEQIIDQQI